jgi:hypothetical protein
LLDTLDLMVTYDRLRHVAEVEVTLAEGHDPGKRRLRADRRFGVATGFCT